MRDALCELSQQFPLEFKACHHVHEDIGTILVMDDLVNETRTRGKYNRIMLNSSQTLYLAVKSITYGFKILNLNDNMTLRSFEMLTSMFASSKQIIQEFIAQYDDCRIPHPLAHYDTPAYVVAHPVILPAVSLP